MPLDPTHVRLTLFHACDQWHSSRESTALTVDIMHYVETLKAWRDMQGGTTSGCCGKDCRLGSNLAHCEVGFD
jgi:hypothetical protein